MVGGVGVDVVCVVAAPAGVEPVGDFVACGDVGELCAEVAVGAVGEDFHGDLGGG